MVGGQRTLSGNRPGPRRLAPPSTKSRRRLSAVSRPFAQYAVLLRRTTAIFWTKEEFAAGENASCTSRFPGLNPSPSTSVDETRTLSADAHLPMHQAPRCADAPGEPVPVACVEEWSQMPSAPPQSSAGSRPPFSPRPPGCAAAARWRGRQLHHLLGGEAVRQQNPSLQPSCGHEASSSSARRCVGRVAAGARRPEGHL
jgi:hypothetical protein